MTFLEQTVGRLKETQYLWTEQSKILMQLQIVQLKMKEDNDTAAKQSLGELREQLDTLFDVSPLNVLPLSTELSRSIQANTKRHKLEIRQHLRSSDDNVTSYNTSCWPFGFVGISFHIKLQNDRLVGTVFSIACQRNRVCDGRCQL